MAHMEIKNELWIEKYRPKKISDIISHDNIKQTIETYLKQKTFPNIILFGTSGIGKTSIMKAYVNQLFGNYAQYMSLEINASEERGISVVRNMISQFSMSKQCCDNSFNIKLVILDEVDSMTIDAQLALKNIIDSYSCTTRFCLICNCVKNLHYSLISRCVKLRMKPLKKNQMLDYIKKIILNEKINITSDAINCIIMCANGDMRKILNVLQSISTTYPEINLKCVNNYLNNLTNINYFIKIILTNNISEAHTAVSDSLKLNGYSISNLIVLFSNELIKYLSGHDNEILNIYSDDQIINLLIALGKIEKKISYGVTYNVGISLLICYCKKYINI